MLLRYRDTRRIKVVYTDPTVPTMVRFATRREDVKTADPVLMAEVSFGMYCCRRGKAPRLPLSFTWVVNGLVLLSSTILF